MIIKISILVKIDRKFWSKFSENLDFSQYLW